MTQPQPLQLIPADMPLSKRLAAMTCACADVSGLSCGFALARGEGVPIDCLYDWYGELRDASRRIEELILAGEKSANEVRYAAMEQEAAA